MDCGLCATTLNSKNIWKYYERLKHDEIKYNLKFVRVEKLFKHEVRVFTTGTLSYKICIFHINNDTSWWRIKKYMEKCDDRKFSKLTAGNWANLKQKHHTTRAHAMTTTCDFLKQDKVHLVRSTTTTRTLRQYSDMKNKKQNLYGAKLLNSK